MFSLPFYAEGNFIPRFLGYFFWLLNFSSEKNSKALMNMEVFHGMVRFFLIVDSGQCWRRLGYGITNYRTINGQALGDCASVLKPVWDGM